MFLSIVIPVYNTPSVYLKECLDSLKLIPKNIKSEVIIVDDESTSKDTVSFLSSVNRDEVTVVRKKNGGPGAARNTGFEISKGKYVFPLDADDVLHSDFEVYINYLKNNSNIDVLYGDLLYFGDVNKLEKNQEFNKVALWFENNIVPMCSFVKKTTWEKVGGFDIELKTFEDYDFWIRCAVNRANFKYLPLSTYKYRVIHDGASRYQNTRKLHKQYFKILRDRIPLKEIKFSDIVNFMKGYYKKKSTDDDGVLKKIINNIKTVFKTIEIIRRITLSVIRRSISVIK